MDNELDKQLTISFEHDTRISDTLAKGLFVTGIEITLTRDTTQRERIFRLLDALKTRDVQNLFLTVNLERGVPAKDIVNLTSHTNAPVVLVLSGAGATVQQLREDAAAARSCGLRNFLCVTGTIAPEHLPNEDGTWSPFGAGYSDSVDILSSLSLPSREQSLGAAVNPYKYTFETQSAQYAKLLRKVRAGAQFFISQAGWDVRKAQELQWFLQMRAQLLYIIARIRVVTPELSRTITDHLEPGVLMPVPLAAQLQRLADTPSSFWTYQHHMNALLAVGLRKLGYSGILLAGIGNIDEFDAFQAEFSALDMKIRSYNEWLDAWTEFLGDAVTAPPIAMHDTDVLHYLFKNLLARDLATYDAAKSTLTHYTLPSPTIWDKMRATRWVNRYQKKHAIASSDTDDKKTAAPPCTPLYNLPNLSCPKRLVHGPCGNAGSDGYCEAGHAPCVFNRITMLAASRGDMSFLEDGWN